MANDRILLFPKTVLFSSLIIEWLGKNIGASDDHVEHERFVSSFERKIVEEWVFLSESFWRIGVP